MQFFYAFEEIIHQPQKIQSILYQVNLTLYKILPVSLEMVRVEHQYIELILNIVPLESAETWIIKLPYIILYHKFFFNYYIFNLTLLYLGLKRYFIWDCSIITSRIGGGRVSVFFVMLRNVKQGGWVVLHDRNISVKKIIKPFFVLLWRDRE